MLERVAPPIEARWDGSHFLTAWHMLRDGLLFWPWYRRDAEAVRDLEPEIEPVTLQRQLLAWLKGRLTYGDYIRAALRYDPDRLLAAVDQPSLVIGSQGDCLEAHAKRAADNLAGGQFISTDRLRAPSSAISKFLHAERQS